MNNAALIKRIEKLEIAVFVKITKESVTTPQEAIASIFKMNNKLRTKREIIQSRSRVSPFKEIDKNKSSVISSHLRAMVSSGKLKLEDGRYSLVI